MSSVVAELCHGRAPEQQGHRPPRDASASPFTHQRITPCPVGGRSTDTTGAASGAPVDALLQQR